MLTRDNVQDYLWQHLRTERKDIRNPFEAGRGDGDLPMVPDKAMDHLGVTADELVALVVSGELPRPGNLGGNRVAWRKDEVFDCGDRLRRA